MGFNSGFKGLIPCALCIILPFLGIKWPVRSSKQPATSIEKYTRKDRNPATADLYVTFVMLLN